MKLTLSLMLLASSAFAGGGGFFNGGGGSASSSTGTHTDGASASFKNVTAETLQSTGTAPSLTATGAVFTSSVTMPTLTGLFPGGVGLKSTLTSVSSITVNSGATTDIWAVTGIRTPLILGGASYSGSTPYVAPGATHLEFNTPTAGTMFFYNQGNEKLSMSGTRLTASVPVKNYARTKAELLAITPAVGDLYYCSDCSDPTSSKATVVIGTAAVQGAFGTLPVGAFQ